MSSCGGEVFTSKMNPSPGEFQFSWVIPNALSAPDRFESPRVPCEPYSVVWNVLHLRKDGCHGFFLALLNFASLPAEWNVLVEFSMTLMEGGPGEKIQKMKKSARNSFNRYLSLLRSRLVNKVVDNLKIGGLTAC
jgi:hypothetical protein